MEAKFKISAAEFNLNLFKKIEDWIKNSNQSEIIISIKNEALTDRATYEDSLKSSIEELSDGKSKTFSIEELNAYITEKF